jgi:predicted DNA-binding antitoxin AbrB/MazE fold protein
MTTPVRAVYKDGQLHLLDPVDLAEGQKVNVIIAPENETGELSFDEIDARLRAAGLLLEIDVPEDAVELTPEERADVGRRFLGDRPSEALIDEDRGLY